jgi:hypothetical protein
MGGQFITTPAARSPRISESVVTGPSGAAEYQIALVEQGFDGLVGGEVDPWEIEQVRRSIAMLPPGHSAGALTKETAMALVHEVLNSRRETDRYRLAVVELRRVLEALDAGPDT